MVIMLRPETRVREDIRDSIEELRQDFRSWQGRCQRCLSFAFGDKRSDGVLDLGSVFQSGGGVQELIDRRSRYLSEWVGTRGEALLNRRFASKTNILPAVYGDTDKERQGGERLIQFALGIFNQLDRQTIDGMGGFSWDYNMKLQTTWTGKTAFTVRVYDGGGGKALVQSSFIDPYNLYHDIDVQPDQRLRVVRDFEIRWADVPSWAAQWGRGKSDAKAPPATPQGKKPSDTVVVSEYWCREPDGKVYRSYLIDSGRGGDGLWAPVRESVQWNDHGYSKVPIVIVSRRASNHQFQELSAGALRTNDAKYYYHAEPFYARAMNLLVFLEGLESLAADNAALAALPIFVHTNPDGGAGIEKKDIRPFAFLEKATSEQIEVLQGIAQGRVTVDEAIGRVNGELNDIFPAYLVSPNVAAGTSGFSFNSQISQAKMYMVPWTRCDEAAKSKLIEVVIDQHMNVHPELAFNLSGVMPGTGAFRRRWKASDYPKGEFEIDIQEPAEIPGEELQNLQAAIQAVSSGLVSLWTARTTKLGINDPAHEQARIDDERFQAGQPNQMAETVRRLQEKADEFAGQNPPLIAAIYRMAVDAAQKGLMDAPNAGYIMPQQPGNAPPEALPPQATTENPNLNALAQGQPGTGMQGRPRPKGQK